MFIYNGKLNWHRYAIDECITMVFPTPTAFSLNDPVNLFWQWTVNATGRSKEIVSELGRIHSISDQNGTRRFSVVAGSGLYSFDGVVAAADQSKVTLTMKSKQGTRSPPFILTLQQSRPWRAESLAAFAGKLNVGAELKDEMFTLVIPNGVALWDGDPVGLYFQWTNNKMNNPVNARLRNTISDHHFFTGLFDDGSYTYQVVIRKNEENRTSVFAYQGVITHNLPIVKRLKAGVHGEGKLVYSESENVNGDW